MRLKKAILALPAMALGTAVSAQDALRDLPIIGAPRPGGTGFQPASTPVAVEQQWLNGMLMVIITFITLFVTVLLAYVIFRYNRKANPTPSSFTHNSPLEIAWTLIPVLILIVIGTFSLPALFNQREIPDADINIKVTGYQWYWGYEYTDEAVAFDSYMIGAPATGGANMLTPEVSAQLAAAGYSDDEFKLATDTAVVVPVGATVVMTVTGADVIHSWTIPAFGVKQDAVPGRLAQLWFRADQEGTYFGQCSELCGHSHAFMPITVKVVSQDVYDDWLAQAKADYPA